MVWIELCTYLKSKIILILISISIVNKVVEETVAVRNVVILSGRGVWKGVVNGVSESMRMGSSNLAWFLLRIC